jgi:hypothetical protein
MAWIAHEGVNDALMVKLIAPGLLTGETLERASYGTAPATVADLREAAGWLKDRALSPFRGLRPRDAGAIAAGVAGLALADSVLHAFGGIPEHQGAGDAIADGSQSVADDPPSRHGFALALTSHRLLLLEVWSVFRGPPRARGCFFGLGGAWAWSRPIAEPASLCFTWRRVLWERQLALEAATADGPREIRFGTYGFSDAAERAYAIATSLGLAPRA